MSPFTTRMWSFNTMYEGCQGWGARETQSRPRARTGAHNLRTSYKQIHDGGNINAPVMAWKGAEQHWIRQHATASAIKNVLKPA